MEYIDTLSPKLEIINEKLIYKNGNKESFRKKQTKNDLKIVGYLEVITIDGIGDIVAKFDTGNGTISSIMCDSYVEKDGYIIWSIGDKKIRSKKIGTSIVKNRNNEERIVIELNIIFDGIEYRKIPFSLVDRSNNYIKVLLNRTFANTCHVVISPSRQFLITKRPKGYKMLKKTTYNGIFFEK